MDLAEEENFIFKHPYFFKNCTFKFEGLKPEIQEKFENIVKGMGARVSDESQYIFTDILHTSLDNQKKYYSLSYFSNSILAEEPLEIEDYRLDNSIQDTSQSRFCCMQAKYILKKSCMRFCNQHICCKICAKNSELLKKRNNLSFSFNQANEETHDFYEEPCLHVENTNNLSLDKSIERVNGSLLEQHEINSSDVNENSGDSHIGNENHNDSIQPLTNGTSHDNGVNEDNSNSSDLEIIEIRSNVNHNKPSYSKEDSEKPKTKKQSTTDRRKRVRKVSSSSDKTDHGTEIRSPTRKGKNKRLRLSSSPSEKTTSNKTSSTESSSDEQNFIKRLNKNVNRYEWWLHLPPPKNPNPNYVESEKKHRGRGRDFSFPEKRLMIAYLVKNDQINDGTSRRPWKQMLKDGYLQGDRTSESLNNHYRKVLLPKIETFELPEDIEKEFIKDRQFHLSYR